LRKRYLQGIMEFQRDVNSFIETQNWIFAKTMADIPHWYCLKSKTPNPDAWTFFVKFMREYGIDGEFSGKAYHYLYWGEYRYWHMDPTDEECDLINRCFVPAGERKINSLFLKINCPDKSY